MYRLVNVPHKDSKIEIRGEVEGEAIFIIAAAADSVWRDGRACLIADTYIDAHLLAKPDQLRKKVAEDLALAIRMARDAGYAHAMADIRRLIGAKDR